MVAKIKQFNSEKRHTESSAQALTQQADVLANECMYLRSVIRNACKNAYGYPVNILVPQNQMYTVIKHAVG